MRQSMKRMFGGYGWGLTLAALIVTACVPPPPPASPKRQDDRSQTQQAMAAFEKGEMAEALKILERLARKGDPKAQMLTARIYQLGRGGVPRNDERAADWFEHAANQGVSRAQLRLAEMIERGAGRPPDQKQAFIWAVRADRSGLPGAPEAVDRIGENLTEEEKRAARAAALAWSPRSVRPGAGRSTGDGTENGGTGTRGGAFGSGGLTY